MAGLDGTRRYLAGAVAARTGDSMCGPALLLAGLAITGSAAEASVLLGAVMVSAAVGGPVFGVLLDRAGRPGRGLAWALAAFAGAVLVILAGLGRVPLFWIVAVALPAGTVGPALSGGWTAQLPIVASAQALPRATALDAMTYDVAGLVGPALAGAVAGVAGAGVAVVAAVVLIALAVPAAATLPPRGRDRDQRPPAATSGLAADLAAGFQVIGGNRPLRRATVVTVVSCMGEGMFVACCPLLGAQHVGGAGRGTVLLSVVAVTGMTANALMVRRPTTLRPDTVIGLSTVVLAAAVLLAATGEPLLIVAAAGLIGCGEGPQLTALFTVRHREAPDRLRSQVFTTGASLKTTAYALGVPLAGALAARSLFAALTTAAAVQATAGLAAWVMRERRPPAST